MRALRVHGGGAGATDPVAVKRGLVNLAHHVALAHSRGLPTVIAVNAFADDSQAEHAVIADFARGEGADFAICRAHAEGGEGALELASTVRSVLGGEATPRPFQVPGDSVADNLERLATTVYGATGVELSTEARRDLRMLSDLHLDHLPVCVAKTPASLTDDPKLLGGPRARPLHVQALHPSAGAGFVVAVAGNILRMPGMPREPGALGMGMRADGSIYGLS